MNLIAKSWLFCCFTSQFCNDLKKLFAWELNCFHDKTFKIQFCSKMTQTSIHISTVYVKNKCPIPETILRLFSSTLFQKVFILSLLILSCSSSFNHNLVRFCQSSRIPCLNLRFGVVLYKLYKFISVAPTHGRYLRCTANDAFQIKAEAAFAQQTKVRAWQILK